MKSFRKFRKYWKEKGPTKKPCEICGEPLVENHCHLKERGKLKFLCACGTCGLLYENSRGSKFLKMSEGAVVLPDFQLSEAHWQKMGIPVGLAFFFRDSVHSEARAFYPGALGVIESSLEKGDFERVVANNPSLASLAEDSEALLINRTQGKNDAYRVPLDECFRLAGIIRQNWRGFSGGEEVHREIENFFGRLL